MLVGWAVFGCALELYRSWWLVTADPWSETEPGTWRMGSGPALRLESFARRIEPQLTQGAIVAVVSEPGPPREREVRALWLAYYLPRQHVRSGQLGDGLPADFWLTYGTRLEREQPIDQTPTGALYRAP